VLHPINTNNITIEGARLYLSEHIRYIKYTRIARELGIDKNMLKNFIDGKTSLKLSQREKIKEFVLRFRF
jgi:hypothetical protein